ncbi:unnamed protein product [Ceratitis capitata]|uniref:(Mediterranean fruit fly) hypothetical protein n=1 Tax=Ceratitis capitata TaxID=7213 RepID=A0A811U4V7_CERCA|nr:unnamed protein product [Ceratitis capitata]
MFLGNKRQQTATKTIRFHPKVLNLIANIDLGNGELAINAGDCGLNEIAPHSREMSATKTITPSLVIQRNIM